MFYVISRLLYKLILVVFFRLKVYGLEHVPKTGGFIVAGNHVSYLDPPVFGVSCPRVLGYMARDTLFNPPWFAWILHHQNVFRVRRGAADFGAIREAFRRLKNGSGLLIFPQGTRSAGSTTEAQSGVGFLARRSGVPVVPAYCDGTDVALPKGSKRVRLAPVRAIFGPPLVFQKDNPMSDEAFAIELMRRIAILKDAFPPQ
jgi:1-acyl-sn-glycerol-3-phosphate acyltransferase